MIFSFFPFCFLQALKKREESYKLTTGRGCRGIFPPAFPCMVACHSAAIKRSSMFTEVKRASPQSSVVSRCAGFGDAAETVGKRERAREGVSESCCAHVGDADALGAVGCIYGAGLGKQAGACWRRCGLRRYLRCSASAGYLCGGMATARTGRYGKRPYTVPSVSIRVHPWTFFSFNSC